MGFFSDLKDAIFGSDSHESTSQSGKTKTTSSTTLTPYDANAISTLKGLARDSSGLASILSSLYTGSELPYTKSLYSANQGLLGNAAQTNSAALAAIQNALKNSSSVSDAVTSQALGGVNAGEKANQAEANVVNAFQKGEDAWRRNLGSYGINPDSVADTSRLNEIEKAKAIAGARTAATDTAEDTSWNRLVSAMNSGTSNLAGLTSTAGAGQNSLFDTGDSNVNAALKAILSAGKLTTPGLATQSTSSTSKVKSSGTGTATGGSSPSWWDILMGNSKTGTSSLLGGSSGLASIFAL